MSTQSWIPPVVVAVYGWQGYTAEVMKALIPAMINSKVVFCKEVQPGGGKADSTSVVAWKDIQ